MHRRCVLVWLMSLSVAGSAIAQDSPGAHPGWKPRHYPELQEIMQAGYSEPVLAPPAELQPIGQTRPIPTAQVGLAEIPSVPPVLNASALLSPIQTVSSGPPPVPPIQIPPAPAFDQQPTVHDTVPWSGDSSATSYFDGGTTSPPMMDAYAPPEFSSDAGDWGGYPDPYSQPYCQQDSLWECETDPAGRFLPFLVFGARANTDRAQGTAEFFWPFWQNEDELLFADFRAFFDDHGGGIGNLGVGYRGFIDPRWILGTYLFLDILHSQYDHTYGQGTLGIELLSLNWDFRFNGYFPHSGSRSAPVRNDTTYGTIIVQNFQERAYGGVNAEMGRRILHWGWNDCWQVYWFAGGYYFGAGSANFEDFGGPQSRLEMRIYDLAWLGEQSRVEMGLETSYDRVHDGQFGGFLRVRIPLGAKADRAKLDPLRRRLVDPLIHDNH